MTEEQTQRPQQATGPRVISGRYALLGEIGRGGMGVVWRAQDQVIGRAVALKELRLPESAEDAGVFQERVLREVRTGGRLNDPAVVTVFDVVHEAGSTYIVMELVEAPTLSDLVRRNGPLPPWQVASIGEQLLSALKAAHDAGIVHRDVKPGNVMVAANGRVKLTDFGIAQAIDDPRLTTAGMIVGSPAFMAPERVQGREALPASDLWSLGATLYFAVEGSVAHERATTAATLHAIMNEVPYLTRAQGPVASAIMGLLISTPEARITALQAHELFAMAGKPTGQGTPPGGYTMHSAGPPTRHATGPTPVPAKPKRALWVTLAAVIAVVALIGGVFLGRAISAPAVDTAMLPTMTYGFQGDIKLVVNSSSACYNAVIAVGVTLSGDNESDCDKSHTVEIYDDPVLLGQATNTTDAETIAVTYPGAEPLKRAAEARCALGFNSDLVPKDKRAGLSYRALVPSAKEWGNLPEDYKKLARAVYCVLTKADSTQLSRQVHVKIK
ncbi:serine/threonine-protein kinase [Amycolatopsis sp.]|uniref:serine/threonine-protein kinase n=1 Tax=Amycolatopsis sp. TaxID=37632 RepID=UPI002E01B440|nr:serine/threonine-protein kinase [Amycolatopsis sp.]